MGLAWSASQGCLGAATPSARPTLSVRPSDVGSGIGLRCTPGAGRAVGRPGSCGHRAGYVTGLAPALAALASLRALRALAHRRRAAVPRRAAQLSYGAGVAGVDDAFVARLVEAQSAHAGTAVLSADDVMQLVQDVTVLLRAEKTLSRMEVDKVVVVGDIHGQFYDLLQIFSIAGWPSEENPYLFNGDFVDRGQHSLEVILTLFAFKLRFPNAVRMNRGNHEAVDLNLRYGFAAEIRDRYGAQGKEVFDTFSEAFRWLPLVHVLNSEVLVVHGGLPGPDPRENFADEGGSGVGYSNSVSDEGGRTGGRRGGGQSLSLLGYNPDNVSLPPRKRELTLADIDSLPRGVEPAADNKALEGLPKDEAEAQRLLVDLLWADPRGKTGYGPSFRVRKGCYIFGPDVTDAFLARNGLRLVIRSHEVKVGGYEWTHPSLITVFSAPNYLGHARNKGAIVRLSRASETSPLEPSFLTYAAAEQAPMRSVSAAPALAT